MAPINKGINVVGVIGKNPTTETVLFTVEPSADAIIV